MRLDVLLVHPNAAKRIYQELSDSLSGIEQPIWAGMIATYLRNKDINVDILDCEAHGLTIEESYDKVKELNPKLICTVVYGQQPSASTQNMVGALELMLRLDDLDIPRVYIGPHPSALPEKTVLDDPNSLVCKGEGPRTLEVLRDVTDFSDYNQLRKIPGLSFLNKETNTVENNAPAQLITNLDEEMNGVAWDLLPMHRYRTANWHSWTNNNEQQPFASLYTSLGCPFKCTFCMINAPFNNGNNKNNTFRHWSPDTIIKNFDYFAKLGIKNVKIADELFVLKPTHFMKVCELLKERDYGFNIWAYSRIDTVREKYLDALRAAGVNWLGLGIESANKNVRFEITKGKFEETNIKDIVHKISEAGINTTGNYIFGLPTDTYETMEETFDLSCELNTEYVNYYCTMAYPGSQLHREASINNPNLLPENNGVGWVGYSQHSYECYPLATDNLQNWEILKFRDEAFLKFFNNQEYINRMTAKFGPAFKSQIQRMLNATDNKPLNRKIVYNNEKHKKY